MSKKIKTRSTEKHEYSSFMTKAQEFYESMNDDYIQGRYAAAVSSGIHCCILAGDACLIFFRGFKCTSQRHLDLVSLIETLAVQGAKEAAQHL